MASIVDKKKPQKKPLTFITLR